MAVSAPLNWPRIAREACVAGIAGGIIIDLYLALTTVIPAHGSLIAFWQWVASAALGKVAFTNPSFAWLGLLIHFIVSIGWAGGYAYLAQRQPFVNDRWLVSGIVYGIVVYGFMQLLLIGAQAEVFPQPAVATINALIAHALFFGVPVAYAIARMDTRRA